MIVADNSYKRGWARIRSDPRPPISIRVIRGPSFVNQTSSSSRSATGTLGARVGAGTSGRPGL
jgi:hypothetical protein